MVEAIEAALSPAEQATLRKEAAQAQRLMRQQLAQMIARPLSAFSLRMPPGFQRGIDFYPATDLVLVLGQTALVYARRHGSLPNLIEPARVTEKIYWSKFFRPLMVPESGNKLATARFIPDDVRDTVSVPPIVWHSPTCALPRAGEIEDGTYYLKANHGADMFRRIEYPLADADREKLEKEFSAFLDGQYGYWSGEWWYNSFEKELLIEKCISSDPHPTAWGFYTFGEEIGPISLYRKVGTDAETAYLNPDFSEFEWHNPEFPRVQFELPSKATRSKMIAAASAIGRAFPFARVDFLLGDREELYLSEVTFSPGNALTAWPDEINLKLGAKWDLRRPNVGPDIARLRRIAE
ncbi:MAG: ATP-grasp fold amidoligase family protein [Sphingomonadales bacterium]